MPKASAMAFHRSVPGKHRLLCIAISHALFPVGLQGRECDDSHQPIVVPYWDWATIQ